jgi:hypothetical protein
MFPRMWLVKGQAFLAAHPQRAKANLLDSFKLPPEVRALCVK